MNRRRLLERLRRGHVQNVPFEDFCTLLEGLGFELVRTVGSHRQFDHPALPETFTVQPRRGDAMAYQLRQCLRLIDRYNLELEDMP
ncbi:MAG TPA: type II toxin-antitoxin system HicA family toxin [Thermoanaerobaculia bacterium]|nr:type II toxin-antitoxin system HicA family toxin [Thermoanaerobaculia bacterium]